MRRTLIVAAVAALAFATVAQAKTCTDPATHKFVKCATADARTIDRASPLVAPTAGAHTRKGWTDRKADVGAPHCSKGKPCGHDCIPMDKVCHK
jgi:hypothetical protein